MMGMRVAPVVVWGKRQNAENTANPVVDCTPGEERAVTAIMLKHEEPKKEGGRRDRQQQGWPIAAVEGDPTHCRPESSEATCCNREFGQTSNIILPPIFGEPNGPLFIPQC